MRKAMFLCLSLFCLFGFSVKGIASRSNTALVTSSSEKSPIPFSESTVDDNDLPIDPCDAALIAILHPGSLKANLARIASENDWNELVWEASSDYAWTGETTIEADSLDALFEKILAHHYPLQATFYQGNHIIVITPRSL